MLKADESIRILLMLKRYNIILFPMIFQLIKKYPNFLKRKKNSHFVSTQKVKAYIDKDILIIFDIW